jgi:hypothetical protein
MLKFTKRSWIASCDKCGTKINTGQRSFQQATIYLSRVESWDSWEHGGDWRNFCPICVSEGDPESDLDQVGIGFGHRQIFDDET